jgi:hypothetical protein
MDHKRRTATLSLAEIGLGRPAQAILYLISCLPLVGFIIGSSYTLRQNHHTRNLGFRLLLWASLIHAAYVVCGCPLALYLAAQ